MVPKMTLLACAAAAAVACGAPSNTAQPSASPASIDPSRVKGRLPPEVIQKVVRDNFGGMRKCYEAALGKDPQLTGKITTRFIIERDGRVSSATDIHDAPAPEELERVPAWLDLGPLKAEPRFPDATVVACVVGRFAALTFPEPQGGVVTVVYPIIFSPGD